MFPSFLNAILSPNNEMAKADGGERKGSGSGDLKTNSAGMGGGEGGGGVEGRLGSSSTIWSVDADLSFEVAGRTGVKASAGGVGISGAACVSTPGVPRGVLSGVLAEDSPPVELGVEGVDGFEDNLDKSAIDVLCCSAAAPSSANFFSAAAFRAFARAASFDVFPPAAAGFPPKSPPLLSHIGTSIAFRDSGTIPQGQSSKNPARLLRVIVWFGTSGDGDGIVQEFDNGGDVLFKAGRSGLQRAHENNCKSSKEYDDRRVSQIPFLVGGGCFGFFVGFGACCSMG